MTPHAHEIPGQGIGVLRRCARYLAAIPLALVFTSVLAQITGPERATAVGTLLVGAPAPRFVLTTIDGETIDLAHLYGRKAVYLKFWATWCGPCRAQMPHFQHTYETEGSDLAVIAINAGFDDPLAEVFRFRKQYGITMPIVRDDGKLATAFHLRVTPLHVVIGRDGRIQFIGNNADAPLDAALHAARAPLAAQIPVSAHAHEQPTDFRGLTVGDRLPTTALTDLDGKVHQMREREDHRPTVLVFLSPWCESYLAETRPSLSAGCKRTREQVTDLAANAHVRWLGIASGLWSTPGDLRKYQTDYSVPIPLTLDASGAVFRTFRVTNVPTVLVADGSGKIVRRLELDDTQELRAIVPAL